MVIIIFNSLVITIHRFLLLQPYDVECPYFLRKSFSSVYLFNGTSISHVLFNAEIWFTSKCLIVVISIFSMFHCIFKTFLAFFKNLYIIICLHIVTWCLILLSNTDNLYTITWLKLFLLNNNLLSAYRYMVLIIPIKPK